MEQNVGADSTLFTFNKILALPKLEEEFDPKKYYNSLEVRLAVKFDQLLNSVLESSVPLRGLREIKFLNYRVESDLSDRRLMSELGMATGVDILSNEFVMLLIANLTQGLIQEDERVATLIGYILCQDSVGVQGVYVRKKHTHWWCFCSDAGPQAGDHVLLRP